ncbi:protein of unknown function (plasmid) [Cupriavidus taiwanensis]|nr:protein of unknown function [Cupriavidus taiwanensis]
MRRAACGRIVVGLTAKAAIWTTRPAFVTATEVKQYCGVRRHRGRQRLKVLSSLLGLKKAKRGFPSCAGLRPCLTAPPLRLLPPS